MKEPSECAQRISRLDWHGLRALWKSILAREKSPEWPEGRAFEHLILRAFQLDGAQVRWPYEVTKVGGQQSEKPVEEIDGAVCARGLWCLVQSKDTEDPQNVELIAKLRNQLLRRPSPTVGLIFSVGGFTGPALILAGFVAPQTILLWHKEDVDYALREESICDPLLRKYRLCVEEGRPDYRIDMEEDS